MPRLRVQQMTAMQDCMRNVERPGGGVIVSQGQDPTEAIHSYDGRWWWDGRVWMPAYSSDGLCWWSGSSWLAAYSADRRFRWDGRRWRRARFRDWPRWIHVMGLAWLCCLGVAVPVALAMHHANAHIDHGQAVILISLGGFSAATTLATGWVLGYRKRWLQVAVFTAAGAVVLLGWYGVAMTATTPMSDTTGDNAVGAGLAILAVPTVAATGLLLVSVRRRQRHSVDSARNADRQTHSLAASRAFRRA